MSKLPKLIRATDMVIATEGGEVLLMVSGNGVNIAVPLSNVINLARLAKQREPGMMAAIKGLSVIEH